MDRTLPIRWTLYSACMPIRRCRILSGTLLNRSSSAGRRWNSTREEKPTVPLPAPKLQRQQKQFWHFSPRRQSSCKKELPRALLHQDVRNNSKSQVDFVLQTWSANPVGSSFNLKVKECKFDETSLLSHAARSCDKSLTWNFHRHPAFCVILWSTQTMESMSWTLGHYHRNEAFPCWVQTDAWRSAKWQLNCVESRTVWQVSCKDQKHFWGVSHWKLNLVMDENFVSAFFSRTLLVHFTAIKWIKQECHKWKY